MRPRNTNTWAANFAVRPGESCRVRLCQAMGAAQDSLAQRDRPSFNGAQEGLRSLDGTVPSRGYFSRRIASTVGMSHLRKLMCWKIQLVPSPSSCSNR